MRRRLLLTLVLALFIGLLGWVWLERVALQAFPDIISAYTAKEYCSCRYVMQQPVGYCRGYVKQWVPTRDFVETPEAKRITVTGLGRTNSARWMGERQGCRLEP